eukprot:gene19262-36723_t
MGDDERTELLYKVLVVGDIGVGKTSLIKRYERFKNLTRVYYKEAVGAVIVYGRAGADRSPS